MAVLPADGVNRRVERRDFLGRDQSRLGLRRAGVITLRLTMALALVGAITLICSRLIHVNATTAGFAYLIGILLIAAAWGLLEATIASVAAMLGFNYFFLPPVGTFTIQDPQNWVALFAFLATSIMASQLSGRAKRRARDAASREREMERLYTLSRAILLIDAKQAVAKEIARQIAHIFELPAVALYERSSGAIHRGGPEDLPEMDHRLRESAIQSTQFRDEIEGVIVTPIQLGGEPIGSIALQGAPMSDTALQSLSNLVAIGLEKARGEEAASLAEAARQSQELKSTLLDAIAHEFKTPLTSIKVATSSLLSGPVQGPREQRELITIVDEEADRLGRLVTDAIQMARIESGKLQLKKELRSATSLIAAALHPLKPVAAGREVETRIDGGLPSVSVDSELIQLAIRHLVDNALKYSPPAAPITISARPSAGNLIISVADQGPGVPEAEQSKIFEKFHRRAGDRSPMTGSGMGLAIAREIVRAHGGDISVKSSPGQGSQFSLSLPVDSREKTT